MDDKAMVACSTVGFKSMADGTVRFTIDVDPPYRAVALGAFSEPGTPCVLTAITKEVAKNEMVKEEERKATSLDDALRGKSAQAIKYHGEHNEQWPSNTAEALCKQGNFHRYLTKDEKKNMVGDYSIDNDYASLDFALKAHCGITSKTELDTNHEALTTFMGMLDDYRKFVQDKQ